MGTAEDAQEGSAALPARLHWPWRLQARVESSRWERGRMGPGVTGTWSLASAERERSPFSQAPKHFAEKLPLK